MVKLILLGIWMVVIPMLCAYGFVRHGKKYRAFGLLPAGILFLWASFQLISVPFILKEADYGMMKAVTSVVWILTALYGAFCLVKDRTVLKEELGGYLRDLRTNDAFFLISAGLALVAVLFQVFMAYRLAYADGDDAYYIVVGSIAESNGEMYTLDPYTGQTLGGLDLRHCLAPFPIWLAMMSGLIRVHVGVAAHSMIPLVLIPVTYLIIWRILRILIPEKAPLCVLFFAVLQIFGNTSIYRNSTFLLTRTRQGKEALAEVVIPFFFLLFLQIMKDLKEQEQFPMLPMIMTTIAACLCSTMGALLVCLLAGMMGLLAGILYKRFRLIAWTFLCCLPAAAYALLYIKLV